MREDYLPDLDGITRVNVSLVRNRSGDLDMQIAWVQNSVWDSATVTYPTGYSIEKAFTRAREAMWQLSFWHTRADAIYDILLGSDQGLSVDELS